MGCAGGLLLVLGAQGAVAQVVHKHSACCGGATADMQCSNADVVKLEKRTMQCALCALDANALLSSALVLARWPCGHRCARPAVRVDASLLLR